MSKFLMILGAFIFAAGLILNVAPWLIDWFGKLPGDIRIQNKNSFIFIPITVLDQRFDQSDRCHLFESDSHFLMFDASNEKNRDWI